jgi:hypothetical protein
MRVADWISRFVRFDERSSCEYCSDLESDRKVSRIRSGGIEAQYMEKMLVSGSRARTGNKRFNICSRLS